MTYYNIVFRAGHKRMARSLAAAGVTGAIIADLPDRGDRPLGGRGGRGGCRHGPAGGALEPTRAGGPHLCPRTGLRLRGGPHGGHRGAGRTGHRRAEGRRAYPGLHGHAGLCRRRGLDPRAGGGGVRGGRRRGRRIGPGPPSARGRGPRRRRRLRRVVPGRDLLTRPRQLALHGGRQGPLPRRVGVGGPPHVVLSSASARLRPGRPARRTPRRRGGRRCPCRSGRQDVGRVGRQRGVGHRLAREDPRVGRADAVALEGLAPRRSAHVGDMVRRGRRRPPRRWRVERRRGRPGRRRRWSALALRPGHTRLVWRWSAECRRRSATGWGWVGSSRARRSPTWGAMASMAWARLARTLASWRPTAGVTAPFATQAAEPQPTPTHAGQLVSRQAAKSMSSAPSWISTRRAGWRLQVGGGHLVAQVAGLLRRAGHWPSGRCCRPRPPRRR